MRVCRPKAQNQELIDHDACGVGFIAQVGSAGTRDVVERALTALARLSHRGGVDSDGSSGDGAGLLTPIPKQFIRMRLAEMGVILPQAFGMGLVFMPQGGLGESRAAVESAARDTELQCVGWRVVPTNVSLLGPGALGTLPAIEQCFFAADDPYADLERQLFLMRKRLEATDETGIYFCSLSSGIVVYKGLLTPLQLRAFYPDLADPEFTAPFAIFHQRYSTNTSPSWQLAQPFRVGAHNGEINTISANRRWMHAREQGLWEQFGADDCFQALEENVSDSASLDNAVELLLRQGFTLAEALLRLVPPAWESDQQMPEKLRAFLSRSARDQEPWDGPAALVFSDGRMVSAKLDRNGLRPLRYVLTSDGLLVCGSEVGLTDLRGKKVIERNRLGPGEILVVDSADGSIFRGAGELVNHLSGGEAGGARAYREVMRVTSEITTAPTSVIPAEKMAAAMGWTDDQFRLLFQPLAHEAKEAIWSMGDDAPPAYLSASRRALWDYCKQRFAQVTNPPIDPLREAHVMSLDVYLGRELVIDSPILDAGQTAVLENLLLRPVHVVDLTFYAADGVQGAQAALERIRDDIAEAMITEPAMILLTDRDATEKRAAVPVLLAVAAAWKEVVRSGGHRIPIVVESGQVIETHHVALLIAAGASAVYPYLAMELAANAGPDGAANYRTAVEAGFRKVLARMGISTVASYRNSHLFETIGLDNEICTEFFEDASSRLGGKTLDQLLEDSLAAHTRAFAATGARLPDAGLYRFRHAGERHSNSPELVRRMHRYIKSATPENYASFAELSRTREAVAVRDQLEIVPGAAIPLAKVESEEAILSRFCAQAMSLGALGPETHRVIAIGMNRLGARSNTGEGGEDPDVYRFEPEAANKVKQIASARFGVTAEYLVRAEEIEIKMAQGSKPGEGGQLPAVKVNSYIARLRHAVPGMSLISPPPHHDIYSIEDLAQLIYDLRAVNPRARIGVKLVSGAGVGIIAAGVAKAGADVITIAGFDGGTGASPLTSIKNTGLPWEIGLRDADTVLLRAGFRDRVRLRVDGGFKFGRDVVMAALLGADEFGFGTAALLAVGCIMARQCHLNTCPAGIATQDEKLRAKFAGKPEMIMNYMRGVAGEVREILATLGARSLNDIVGSVGRLRPKDESAARSLGSLIQWSQNRPRKQAPAISTEVRRPEVGVDLHYKLEKATDRLAKPNALSQHSFTICNSDRSIGAHLSGHILRGSDFAGLGAKTARFDFRGSAGQSFGAFLVKGVHFRLSGEANDYVGKGLSGGTIAITAGAAASQRSDVLAGNTVLYGATSGELYVAGRAGERFAVRNSGAFAVVEGVGQHGCEYMTAGVVMVLGRAGRNFGSGMTGGLAYMLEDSISEFTYNQDFVRMAEIGEQEDEWLRMLLGEHLRLTVSPQAKRLLRSASSLPLVRLEPVRLPCPLEETWSPFLSRFDSMHRPVLKATAVARREDARAAQQAV
jgi:glutamate synthase domain-containing protein 2/glutamate synthase domain-containing protein 1/glutamate synthase domain-containing protein 3